MVRKNVLMNMGVCMGVVNSNVYSPKPGVAKLDVGVQTGYVNPDTGKNVVRVLNFVALGETADSVLRNCKKGSVVMLTYRLSEHVVISRNTGVGHFVTEFVIVNVDIRHENHKSQVYYRNEGVLDATFLGIEKVPNTDHVYTVDVVQENPETKATNHFRFFAYGDVAVEIQKNCSKNKPITLVFKIDKAKRARENEKSAYFTNLVVKGIY